MTDPTKDAERLAEIREHVANNRVPSWQSPDWKKHCGWRQQDIEVLLREIEALIQERAALRELEASGWRSIDSIPDDVRYDDVVLLFKPDERRSAASRFIGYWDDKANGWMPVYGSYVVGNVTHWMPLPAPPGASDGGEG